jgi:3-hydroxyacyl-CoA dehydrogenase
MSNATTFLKSNIGLIGAGVGGAAIGAGLAVGATALARKKRRKKAKRKTPQRNRTRVKKKHRVRHRKTPRTAGKRKDTSHKRIRHTKNGQPYIILANGRARFIKKKSSRTSRKRKGGRY